jgi:hypothetical protein
MNWPPACVDAMSVPEINKTWPFRAWFGRNATRQ